MIPLIGSSVGLALASQHSLSLGLDWHRRQPLLHMPPATLFLTVLELVAISFSLTYYTEKQLVVDPLDNQIE
jgi:hypothetical protein